MSKSFIKDFNYSEVVKKYFIKRRQQPSKKRERYRIYITMTQEILSEEEKYGFEVFKYSYPTGSVNAVLAYNIVKDVLGKIDKLPNKESLFLKEELDFFKFIESGINKKFQFNKQNQINSEGVSLAVKAIRAKLLLIETKLTARILEYEVTPFIEKLIYAIQLFKKALEINTYNWAFYSKSRAGFNINRYDRLSKICEAYFEFGIILLNKEEKEFGTLIYDLTEIFTPETLYHYKKKLAII